MGAQDTVIIRDARADERDALRDVVLAAYREYAALKTEYDLLNLLDLDQNLDRAQNKSGEPAAEGSPPAAGESVVG